MNAKYLCVCVCVCVSSRSVEFININNIVHVKIEICKKIMFTKKIMINNIKV